MLENIEMLEVVDENDVVIGIEERNKIHELGLLHREVHVIFVTPKREIIFQHREKNKSSMPDKLDATVGGHLDPGENIAAAAIREAKEETGIDISESELLFAGKVRSNIYEEKRGIKNYIGGNVLIEMGQAFVNDKKIFFLNGMPEGLSYMDEIIAMNPICLEGKLEKIKEYK